MDNPESLSLLCKSRIWLLHEAIKNTLSLDGEIWECGAFQGGTAAAMKLYCRNFYRDRVLRMFDTFTGMPVSSKHDKHPIGSFADASYDMAKWISDHLGGMPMHVGVMPASFAGLEDKQIVLAHIDVDNYDSVNGCLEFIFPRTPVGGWLVIDDYGCANCPGAKLATDEFVAAHNQSLVRAPDHKNPQAYFIKI